MFFTPPAVAWISTLSLHDALPISRPYGIPSQHENKLQRRESPGLTRVGGSSVSFAPLQGLFGIITPSGVHFERQDRKSTRLNSSHQINSYAVFCLKKQIQAHPHMH